MKTRTKAKSRGIQSFFFHCWWAILLIVFGYGIYLHGMHKKKELLGELKGKVLLLEQQLIAAKEEREDLLLQIESQSDPAWIEMLIKKNLGMVPKGQTKVYFEKE